MLPPGENLIGGCHALGTSTPCLPRAAASVDKPSSQRPTEPRPGQLPAHHTHRGRQSLDVRTEDSPPPLGDPAEGEIPDARSLSRQPISGRSASPSRLTLLGDEKGRTMPEPKTDQIGERPATLESHERKKFDIKKAYANLGQGIKIPLQQDISVLTLNIGG